MGSLLMHRKTNRPISICEFSIRTKSIDPIRITEKSILLKIGRQRLKFCLHPLKKRKKRCLLQPKMQNKHHFFGMDRFPSVISKNKTKTHSPVRDTLAAFRSRSLDYGAENPGARMAKASSANARFSFAWKRHVVR